MRLKSDCDTAFLLYQITKAKLCYRHTLKDIIEKEAREEEEENRRTDRRQSWLVPQEHGRALKGAYKALQYLDHQKLTSMAMLIKPIHISK